jgi:hypothetical protein
MKIEPGIYELDSPIPNPHPDRKSPLWAKLQELPAGTYKVVQNGLSSSISRHGSFYEIYELDPRYQALAGHLKIKDKLTLRDIVNEGKSSWDAETILVSLAETGKITHADIQAAKAYFESLDYTESTEMFIKHGYPR